MRKWRIRYFLPSEQPKHMATLFINAATPAKALEDGNEELKRLYQLNPAALAATIEPQN
ncbi:MAG: hypothetical protein NT086_11210 [Proteobacteria bacterium]|nr:hypothetical protein [Pseudomonadota bacterium]